MGIQRLDEVSIFGEKVRFLIPHEWVEDESEEDTYLYHAPEAKSGWLRVSLITVRTDTPEERLRGLFSDSEYFTSEQQGNLVARSEKQSRENGAQIYIYYWQVANAVQPNRVFQAVFSYTVLADKCEEPETQKSVELVGDLVSEAVFGNGSQ
jgi:hypothetical protein